MTVDLQKLLNELEHFSAILKNASELCISASELMKYCLPQQTLKELIESLWCAELQSDERQKVRKIVDDIIKRILTNTASAIRTYAEEKSISVNLHTMESWELYDKCNGDKLVDVLSNCFFLFYAVNDVRSIPRLFSLDEVVEFEMIHCAIQQLLGLDEIKKKLPEATFEMYKQKTRFNEEVRSVFARKTFLFHTTKAANTEDIDAKEITEKFAAAMEKLISKISAHDIDISEMHELLKFNLTGKLDFVLFKKACSILPEMQEFAEFHVIGEFLKVLKCLAYSYNDWNAVMAYFYNELREVNGSPKNFKQFYENYDEDMRNLLTYLEDHAQLHTNQVKLEKAVDECAWLLMISPVSTLISLFLQCLENVLMVPNLIRILRKLPEYCDIELEAVFGEDNSTKQKTFGKDSSTEHKTPIVIFALRHILTTERSYIQSDAKHRNFVYLCVALCRERHMLSKDGDLKDEKDETGYEKDNNSEAFMEPCSDIVDYALMDGSVILNHLVLPALKQVFYQEIAIEIGRKLLTSIGTRRTPIIWKAEKGVKLTRGEIAIKNKSEVSILQLISILLNIVNENEDFNDCALLGYCQDCLRLLGERLQEDGVLIEIDKFDGLLTRFDKSLWACRYAVASWFYKCLASYKREVPLVLYEALKEENRETLKSVKIGHDDSDVSGRSLLRKIFNLAIIHSDLALDIIKDGFSKLVIITGHDVSGALVDVIRDHSKVPSNKIDGLIEVIKVIVNQLDLSRQMVHLLTEISESSFYGLRLIEPLLLIQEAVICAIYYDKKSTEDLSPVPFSVLEIENEVAVRLLKLFCELAKDHIQKEMIDLRRSNIKRKVEIKEPRPILSGVNINREIRVETQLIQLYFATIILANHIIGLPPYVKILLVQLTNFHIEMGRMKLGPAFDEIINKTLLDRGAKGKTTNSKQPLENNCAVSDSDQGLASADMNCCSTSRTFAISNNGYEANRMIDITNTTVEAIRDSSGNRPLENFEQNAIFMAGTRMIKDQAMSTIIENQFLHNKRNKGWKSAAGPKARHGQPLSSADNRDCIRSSNDDNGRVNSGDFRRKNKKRK